MTCHRRYTFEFQAADVGHDAVQFLLDQACEDRWWFTSPEVTSGGDGHMLVTFQVVGRDQWWAHRRAMELMTTVVWDYGYNIPVPTWETLPPHTNRGYSRIRK